MINSWLSIVQTSNGFNPKNECSVIRNFLVEISDTEEKLIKYDRVFPEAWKLSLFYPQTVSVCENGTKYLTVIDVLMNKSKYSIAINIIQRYKNSNHSKNSNKKMLKFPKR